MVADPREARGATNGTTLEESLHQSRGGRSGGGGAAADETPEAPAELGAPDRNRETSRSSRCAAL